MEALTSSCPDGKVPTELGICVSKDPVNFVMDFYGIGLGIIGGIATLSIIYGGYLILTSQGNPTQLSKGKSYILYAIVGLLLAIFGFVFVKVLAGDILQIPGFE